MFPPLVRWALVAACLIGAVVLWNDYPVSSLGLLAASFLWTINYWRYGSVGLAFRAWKKGRLADMETHLARTPNPDLLAGPQRISWEFLSGVSARRRDDLPAARRHFYFATLPRRYNKVRALAYAQLAETEVAAGDLNDARASIAQARPIANAHVEAMLNEIERSIQLRET